MIKRVVERVLWLAIAGIITGIHTFSYARDPFREPEPDICFLIAQEQQEILASWQIVGIIGDITSPKYWVLTHNRQWLRFSIGSSEESERWQVNTITMNALILEDRLAKQHSCTTGIRLLLPPSVKFN